MKREYANNKGDQIVANFFTGVEVEHTPAHNMPTLFVVGLHSQNEIIAQIEKYNNHPSHNDSIKHIYFGANQSLKTGDAAGDWERWGAMVRAMLNLGYWATLDVEPADITHLLEEGLCEYRKFIPMISVKLPYINQLNYNATIKVDDIGFEATNPGVWCHRVHDLMDTNKFTTWDKYTEDKLL